MSVAVSAGAKSGKISFWEKIGYGTGDLASNLVFQVLINFIQAYYTDTLLLDPARIALIFGVVRLFDAITDPIMGGIADRTQTRFGQFRPWLLWLALPFAGAYVLAFSIGGFEEPAKSWAAFATYFLLLLVYTAVNIPYGALATAITPDPDERMSLRSWQFAMAQTGTIVVGAATIPLVKLLGDGDDLLGFQLTVSVYAVLAAVLFLICFVSTRERVTATGNLVSAETASNIHAQSAARRVSVLKDLWALLRNDQWLLLAVINFFLLVCVVLRGANTFYYAKYVLEDEAIFSKFLTLGAVAAVVGSIVAGRFMGGLRFVDFGISLLATFFVLALVGALSLTGLVVELNTLLVLATLVAMLVGGFIAHVLGLMFNRVFAFVGLFTIQGLAHFLIYLWPDGSAAFALGIFVLIMFLNQVGVPVLWSMLSDCVDYGQYKTGIRNNGLVFSSALFSLKLGVTAGGIIGGLVLAYTGYSANETQTPRALEGILWCFTILPGIAALIVAAISLKLKLTEGFVRDIQSKNEASGQAVG